MQTPLSNDTAYRPPGYSPDRWHSANVIPAVVDVVSTAPPVAAGSVQATPTNETANRDKPPTRVQRMGSFLGIMSALSDGAVVLLSGGTGRPAHGLGILTRSASASLPSGRVAYLAYA